MKKDAPDTILQEAKDRFKRCQAWEAESRKRFVADRKFANADADNGWQWDDGVRDARNLENRPCLTINKTRQHNLQIINDAKKNKPEIRLRPVGDGASYESAQVFQSVARHIEYISNAESAYDRGLTFAVEAGIGYWRVVTDYADSESLDQDIFIRPVKDPLAIYLDPDIREADGSDARFGFVFDDMSHDEFKVKFPQYKDAVPPDSALGAGNDWLSPEHVRVAEYFFKRDKPDTLISWVDPQSGERTTSKASVLGKVVTESLLQDQDTRSRDVNESVIEWRTLVGNEFVDKKIWPGRYIPIIRVVGEETIIDGKLDRKGHTRSMKDPQRQYNFWSSSAAEFVALQGKSPFIAPARAIEGLEKYWETANTENHAILPYNDIGEDGQPIARPERSQPPVMAPAYVSGMQIARQELMEASGQYQAEMGAPSNERSGVAIEARQRQGDTATFHFNDNQAVAIRFTGMILIDLVPKIYDTQRIIQLLASDGSANSDAPPVTIDPQAKQALQEQTDEQGQVVSRIFNPNVGRYDVAADIGPDFATRRQETFSALMELVKQDSQILPVVGDILFRAADFAMAGEIATRMKNMIPPQALGGPSPELQQAQQQVQQLQSGIQKAVEALADEKKKTSVEAYKAETGRIAIGKDIDPAALVPAIHAAVMAALGAPSLDPAPAMPMGQPIDQGA
jgi:hypothetical protein